MKINVLVFEEPEVAKVVGDYLTMIEATENVEFDVMHTADQSEALGLLQWADMAVVDVWGDGREVARTALRDYGLPVIAMVDEDIPPSADLIDKSLKLIKKPEFDLGEFRSYILDLMPREAAFAI